MSNLVNHARVELELIESDPWLIEGMLKIVQAFADLGHTGSSASVAIPMLSELLQFHNLSPLTDSREEWVHQEGNLWQNTRRSEAFSLNGGVTYYLLSENNGRGPSDLIFHESKHFEPRRRGM